MRELVLLLVVSCSVGVAIVVWRAGSNAEFRSTLTAYELQFPRALKADAVTSFVVGLTGLRVRRAAHWHVTSGVVFETHADHDGIRHYLLVPKRSAEIVLAALRATLPAVRVSEVVMPPAPVEAAVQLGLSDPDRVLATNTSGAVSTGLLASLQPLGVGEQVVVQWVARPMGPVFAPRTPDVLATGDTSPRRVFPARAVDAETAKARRVKESLPLFSASLRIGVTGSAQGANRRLLRRVVASFQPSSAPGAHLFRQALPSWLVCRNLAGRFLPLLSVPCLLNAGELGMLVAFPVGDVSLPGLRLGASRLLAPSADIPSRGRIVAQATFPGAERPLALPVADALRHLHVIGPTGVGKSTLLTGLIAQDMAAGRGVVVIDPKGDLASDVLDRVPKHRVHDVVVLDPSDEERPVGLNLLAGSPDGSELLVDQIVGTLHNLFHASWGPRTDDILRSALLTLVGEPGMTLCEVPLLLTNQAFRRWLVGRIDDPVALGPFWAWYEALSDAERAQAIGPVLNKLRAFLLRRRLRNVLGQADAPLDLSQVLRDGKILIVPLAKGALGEEAAALVGSLLMARLWQAVMARTSQLPENRRPVFCYLDEFQDFLKLPTSIADVLAQARGLGMGMTLAHQHLGQLPSALKEDVLANARSRVIFQTAASDAARLGREVAPHLSPADLQNLGPYEVVVTLSAGNRIAAPASGRTVLPPPSTGMATAVREHSRRVYGQDRDAIEAAIRARHGGSAPAGGIGRQEVPR